MGRSCLVASNTYQPRDHLTVNTIAHTAICVRVFRRMPRSRTRAPMPCSCSCSTPRCPIPRCCPSRAPSSIEIPWGRGPIDSTTCSRRTRALSICELIRRERRSILHARANATITGNPRQCGANEPIFFYCKTGRARIIRNGSDFLLDDRFHSNAGSRIYTPFDPRTSPCECANNPPTP